MKHRFALVAIALVAIGLLAGCMAKAPLTWDYVGSVAQENMPQIREIFFWREVEDVGYAVIDMPWIDDDPAYSEAVTWIIVNGRACGLERVVLMTTTPVGDAHLTGAFVHAYGEGLANWPQDAVDDEGLTAYLGSNPPGASAYSLPYYMAIPIDPEDETTFDNVVEFADWVLDQEGE